MRFLTIIFAVMLFTACQNKQTADSKRKATSTVSVVKTADKAPVKLHTDTLQFIHFEGNYDYWAGIFINARKDTIRLVTDSVIAYGFKNKLFEVEWFVDTLHEAGNDSYYAAKRMSQFRVVDGNPFVVPISEEQILRDVKNLPEVRGEADHVAIAEQPEEGKDYYLVETRTHDPGRSSPLYTFRVYTYPHYEIRIYNRSKD